MSQPSNPQSSSAASSSDSMERMTPQHFTYTPSFTLKHGERGVLCEQCDHLNPGEVESCIYCRKPLYTLCKSCGKQSPLSFTRCRECNQPLKGRGLARLRTSSGRFRFSEAQLVFLFMLLFLGVFSLITYFTWDKISAFLR